MEPACDAEMGLSQSREPLPAPDPWRARIPAELWPLELPPPAPLSTVNREHVVRQVVGPVPASALRLRRKECVGVACSPVVSPPPALSVMTLK